MHLRILYSFITLMLLASGLHAQTSSIRGMLMDEDNRARPANVNVTLKGGSTINTFTKEDGSFEFSDVPFGEYVLEIAAEGYEIASRSFSVVKSMTDLGTIPLTSIQNALQGQDNVPAITLSDNDLAGQGGQSVAGVLSASRDPYMAAVAFNFSAARFRNRGYDNEKLTLMNGIPVEDLSISRTLFGTWAGLND
ncbi:MAG: beta-sandwich domain-containing protein, partial [Bacteroidota bacterium]